MAEIKTVTPEETQALLAQGYTYLDVRTEQEFEQGHVPGALNLPLMLAGPGGFVPNPEFLDVAKAALGTGERLIVGCKAGGRSRRAAEMLQAAGYTAICDMNAGFDAGRDAFGRALPGWSRKGLPVETGKTAGGTYDDVKRRTPSGG